MNINLLPKEIVAARQRRRVRMYLIVLAVGVLLLWAGAYSVIVVQTQAFRAQTEMFEQQLSALEIEMEGYGDYHEMNVGIKKRTDSLIQAMGNGPDWVSLLEGIRYEIPDDVWLIDMAMDYELADGSGWVVIRGDTYDHPSTAEWIRAMQRVDGLDDVRCSFTTIYDDEQGELVRFETSAVILSGQGYEVSVGGDGQ